MKSAIYSLRFLWIIGTSGAIYLLAAVPAFAADGVYKSRTASRDPAEVLALRRELEAAKAVLDQMKRLSDEKIKALQERLTRLERAEPTPAPLLLPVTTQPEQLKAAEEEKGIELGEIPERKSSLPGLPEIAGTKITGFVVGSFHYNTDLRFPGSTVGFKREVEAPADPEDTNFRFNTFNIGFTKRFADWLIGSAAIEVENEREFEGEIEAGVLGIEKDTEVEIDTFEITGIAPIGNGLRFSFGKFNVPFGIEREDPPFNLQATNSLIFELGRPSKVLGVRAGYQFNPIFDLELFTVNGWDVDEDNNDGKTVGGRLGFRPIEGLNLGVGGFYGAEQDDRSGLKRGVIDLDAVYTGIPKLTLAAEFVYGTEDAVPVFRAQPGVVAPLDGAGRAALVERTDVEWVGVSLVGHYDFSKLWGLTLRYDIFDDRDGGRTGFAQTLQSLTVAPTIHLSSLIPGLETVGTAPRTKHLISNVDLRLEYRLDLSNEDVFIDDRIRFDDTNHRVTIQLVANF
ncbi:MAG: outer membrane beta-barrel protein [Candidatus Methylomirabilales bacterium]